MAVQDIRLFPQVMKEYSVGLEDATKRLTQSTAKAGLRTVVYGTPVDTGRAANNWVVTINMAFPGYINTGNYSDPAQVVGQGYAVIDSLDTKRNTKDNAIYIVNNAPYIELLNSGRSNKKPAGFIERAMDIMANRVKGEVGGKFLKRKK